MQKSYKRYNNYFPTCSMLTLNHSNQYFLFMVFIRQKNRIYVHWNNQIYQEHFNSCSNQFQFNKSLHLISRHEKGVKICLNTLAYITHHWFHILMYFNKIYFPWFNFISASQHWYRNKLGEGSQAFTNQLPITAATEFENRLQNSLYIYIHIPMYIARDVRRRIDGLTIPDTGN